RTYRSKETIERELDEIDYRLRKIEPKPNSPSEISKDLGQRSVEQSRVELKDDRIVSATFYEELSEAFLNLALGFSPPTAFAQSAYELWSGRELFTNRELPEWER